MARKNQHDMLINSDSTYMHYFYQLQELALSTYEWKNLPDTCDTRLLELALLTDGMAVFFKDEELGFLTLQVMIGGQIDIYRVPTIRTAYAPSGYRNTLDPTNSVVVFNNYSRQPSIRPLMMFANRLTNIEKGIDVNVFAQKTPYIIKCPDGQRLTLENLFLQYKEGAPIIYGTKDLDLSAVEILKTDAPFVADKLEVEKMKIFNQALTYLGIENANTDKPERLVADEVSANLGVVEMERFTRLNARRDAVAKINKMFNLNIEVNFRASIGEFNIQSNTTPEELQLQQEGIING